jgi:hypothetical protein
MHPDHVNFRVKNRLLLMNFRIFPLQSTSQPPPVHECVPGGIESQISLPAVLCGRLDRHPNSVTHNRLRGVLTELIPNCSNFDCESEGDGSSPRVKGEKPRGIFSGGGAGIAHGCMSAEKPPHNVSGSSILPTPGSEEPQKSFRIHPILFNTPEFGIEPF